MAIISSPIMSVLCTPLPEFGSGYLSASSSYTEAGLVNGVPSASSVAGEHTIAAATLGGVTEAYAVEWRCADSGGGGIGGGQASRWIWRDTAETGAGNDWRGWGDVDKIRDALSVNQAEGTGGTHYQYPTGIADKHGNFYVGYSNEDDIGVSKRTAAGVWSEDRAVISSSVIKLGGAQRQDPGWAYVEATDALYLFFPTADDSASPSKMSIGVAVSHDQATTWSVITSALLPFDDSSCLSYSTSKIVRPRVAYNPVSDLFTLCFQYNGIVYTARIGFDFYTSQWGEAIAGHTIPEIVVLPGSGREHLVCYDTSATDWDLYTREAGGGSWTEGQTYTYTPDTGVGIAGWVHHDGRPIFLWSDSASGEALAAFVDPDATWTAVDAFEFDFSPLSGAGKLQHIAAARLEGGVLIIGNPSSGNTDEIVGLIGGGFCNLPIPRFDTSFTGPWDLPSNQSGDITWSESTATGATIASDWDAGYLALTMLANGVTAGGAVGVSVSGAKTTAQGAVVLFKVLVQNAETTPDGTVGSRPYFTVTGYTGAQTSSLTLALSDDGYQLLDLAGAETAVSLPLFGNTIYFLIAFDASSYEARVWHSTDGVEFTQGYDLTVANSASATAAQVSFAYGCAAGDASSSALAYWSMVGVDCEISTPTAQRLITYADKDAAATDPIDLDGMPIGPTPAYVTKGLYLYGRGLSAAEADLWTVASTATSGIINALIDGDDSPRIRWTQSGTGNASVVWDVSDEPVYLRRGFIYLDCQNVTALTLTQADAGGGSTGLATVASTAVTLGGAWARTGNSFRATAAGSSLVYYQRNQLAGSQVKVGTSFYAIKRNSPGYWSTGAGLNVMRLEVSGDPSGEASTGSDLLVYPRHLAVVFAAQGVGNGANTFTLALTGNGAAAIDVGKLLGGDIYPMPTPPDAGRRRGIVMNHDRRTSPGGYSSSEKLGPTARTRAFSVRHSSRGDVRFTAQSSVQTNQVGWDTGQGFADAHQTVDVIESVAAEHGATTPIVFVEALASEPGVGSNAVVIPFSRALIYGYLSAESMDVTAENGLAWGREIETLTSVEIMELV